MNALVSAACCDVFEHSQSLGSCRAWPHGNHALGVILLTLWCFYRVSVQFLFHNELTTQSRIFTSFVGNAF